MARAEPQAQVTAAFHTNAFVLLGSLAQPSSFQLKQAHHGLRGVGLAWFARTVERLGVTWAHLPAKARTIAVSSMAHCLL